ncbi:fumarylacetoacetate hydrolase family protein [Glaciibacter sp. 2TAF33]|uniref:fumarylacetoacetate hydrolase family protein n=1 Tax=Glaciibacter sp. 2TAF33 TaxID=3233015 RepID=UPI003F92D80A
MTNLRIVNYRAGRGPRVGIVSGDEILDAAALTGVEAYASIGNLMRDWDQALERVRDALDSNQGTGRTPLAGARLDAPVRHGAAIYGAGANYYGHSREMATIAGRPAPEDPRTSGQLPWHFLKAPSTVVGDAATVARPAAAADTLDWEVELAVVIGSKAKNVSAEAALSHVAGYTVANDLSARGLLWRAGIQEGSPFRADWVLHKNFDGSTPLGPWLVPAAEIADPQDLALGLSINGQTMQSDRTVDMIFTIAEQIAHLSSYVTLTPGDIILTGTPGGNAAFHGRFLQPEDAVEAWVEGIGTLTTHIV